MKEHSHGMSGHTGCVNPPEESPCRHCWFSNLRAYPSRYGGGSSSQKHITIEGLEDFNRTLRALGALIEDIAVSLGVEVKARNFLTEGRMMNGFTPESPSEVVEEESGMGSRQPGIGGKVQEYGA